MNREEAIKIIDCYDIGFYDLSGEKIPAYKLMEAFDMAIESLQSNIMTDIVRCKDCRYKNECHKSVQYTRNEPNSVTIGFEPIEWCSRGERREE